MGVDPRTIDELSRLHPRICPRQILGVRIGRRAGELLGLALPRSDKQLVAIVEIDGCFADAVSVATGCWLGQRTLRVADYGKVAATFVDLRTGQAVRIWTDPHARVTAERYAPNAPDRWHAQLHAYGVMPTAELLHSRRVAVHRSFLAGLDRTSERVTCGTCEEEIANGRAVLLDGVAHCQPCVGNSYYVAAEASCKHHSAVARPDLARGVAV